MTDTAPATPSPRVDPLDQEYELVPIDSLEAHPDNPNLGDDVAVGESIAENGYYGALICQRSRRRVLVGHTRWRADTAAGAEVIPVIWVDCDDYRARKIMLADNEYARKATTDNDLLALNLQALLEDDYGTLIGTGKDTDDLEQLLAELAAGDTTAPNPGGDWLGDPDEPPPIEEQPLSSDGDVWTLGPHRLVCGDSTTPDAYALLFLTDGDSGDRETAQLVWTDPPYGVAVVGGSRAVPVEQRRQEGKLSIDNDDLSIEDLEAFLRKAFDLAFAACAPGSSWFVAAPAGPQFLSFAVPLLDLGIWRQTLVWAKDSLVLSRFDYHYRHEAIFYGWKPGGPHHQPADRSLTTVWEVPRPRRNDVHPTMKPLALIQPAIEYHTELGAVVLDPFGGSGSTLMAAHGCGRRARLIEKDPRYVDAILRRWSQATGLDPVRPADGTKWSELSKA